MFSLSWDIEELKNINKKAEEFTVIWDLALTVILMNFFETVIYLMS